MHKFPTEEQMQNLSIELDRQSDVPSATDAEQNHTIYWHVFRRKKEAIDFAQNIMLSENEQLHGGKSRDSIGLLWWLGVYNTSEADWQESGKVHHNASSDPHSPKNGML